MFFNGIGAIARQVKKYQNMIINGKFDFDTDGNGYADNWRAGGAGVTNPSIANNTQHWLPTGTTYSTGVVRTNEYLNFISGHKYYLHVEDQKNIRYFVGYDVNIGGSINITADGEFSSLFTVNGTVSNGGVGFNSKTANETSYVKKVFLFDITYLPEEQQTLEWCGANIAPNITW